MNLSLWQPGEGIVFKPAGRALRSRITSDQSASPPQPALAAHLRRRIIGNRFFLPTCTGHRFLSPCLQITGPLIRIIGDRFPWQIKAAILKTLGLLIRCGLPAVLLVILWSSMRRGEPSWRPGAACQVRAVLGLPSPARQVQRTLKRPSATCHGRGAHRTQQIQTATQFPAGWRCQRPPRPLPPHPPCCSKAGAGLKPFVPQLQTTFVKCLSDPQKEASHPCAAGLAGLWGAAFAFRLRSPHSSTRCIRERMPRRLSTATAGVRWSW